MVRDTAAGWRVWYTRPAEEQLVLYSAVYGTGLRGVERSACRTGERVMRSTCLFGHDDPPPSGCACGVYAVANVVDGLYRVRAMAANIRRGDFYPSWFLLRPDRRRRQAFA